MQDHPPAAFFKDARRRRARWPLALLAVAIVLTVWMALNVWGDQNPRRAGGEADGVVQPAYTPPPGGGAPGSGLNAPASLPVEGVGDASRGESGVRGDGRPVNGGVPPAR